MTESLAKKRMSIECSERLPVVSRRIRDQTAVETTIYRTFAKRRKWPICEASQMGRTVICQGTRWSLGCIDSMYQYLKSRLLLDADATHRHVRGAASNKSLF